MADSAVYQPLPPFEELVALAQENPTAFKMLKRDICEEAIEQASDKMQERLWAFQSHIDRVIDNCKNPDHINVRLMKELTNQVIRFQDSLNGIGSYKEPKHNAQILQFPR